MNTGPLFLLLKSEFRGIIAETGPTPFVTYTLILRVVRYGGKTFRNSRCQRQDVRARSVETLTCFGF